MIGEVLDVVLVAGIDKGTLGEVELLHVSSNDNDRNVLARKQVGYELLEVLIYKRFGNNDKPVELVGKNEVIDPVFAEKLLFADVGL